MSLINDALKKAKQAQAAAPVRETAPQLRSPEQDHPVRSKSSLALPMVLAVVILGGAGAFWLFLGPRGATVNNPVASQAEPGILPQTPAPSRPVIEQAVAPASGGTISSAQKVQTQSSSVDVARTPAAEAAPQVSEKSPAPAPVAAASAVPAVPKLNGIFFNPARPTAIVNNKLVSAGSRVGEFTVTLISSNGVTLVGGGRTNVLSLSE